MKKSKRGYSEMLKSELLAIAQRLGLTNLSRLRKDEIIDLIKRAQRQKAKAVAARKPGPEKSTSNMASKSASKKATTKKSTSKKFIAKKMAEKTTTMEKVTEKASAEKAVVKKVAKEKQIEKATPKKGPTKKTTAVKASSQKATESVKELIDKEPAKKAKVKEEAESRNVKAKKVDPKPATKAEKATKVAAKTIHDRPEVVAHKSSKASSQESVVYQPEELQGVDEKLPDLPETYGENRIVLLPRDPSWLFAYWNLTSEYKEAARAAGGQALAIRLYDVTGMEFDSLDIQAMYEHECTEWARSWYLPVPVPGREYMVEIGYRGGSDWYPLARSSRVNVPAEHASDGSSYFATIGFSEDLGQVRDRLPHGSPEGGHAHLQMLYEDGDLRIIVGTNQSPSGAPNIPLFSKVMLGAAEELPSSFAQVPGSVPWSIAQIPGSLQVPGSYQEVPGSLQQVPGSFQQVPGSLQQVPGSLGHLAGSVGLGGGIEAGFELGTALGGGNGIPMIDPSQVGIPVVLEEANKPMLQASMELVISGRSFPDTDLSVAGQTIPVGPDGGFSLRVSIPEGLREIPIEAKSRNTSGVRRIMLKFGSQLE